MTQQLIQSERTELYVKLTALINAQEEPKVTMDQVGYYIGADIKTSRIASMITEIENKELVITPNEILTFISNEESEQITSDSLAYVNAAEFHLENGGVFHGSDLPVSFLSNIEWDTLSKDDAADIVIDKISSYVGYCVEAHTLTFNQDM